MTAAAAGWPPAIISPHIRVRVPEGFVIGAGSVVDDYSYFSTRVQVGSGSHVASCVTVGGGRDYLFSLGDYSSVSAGVRIWCASEDFRQDLAAMVPGDIEIGKQLVSGDVSIGNCCIIGANSVILPDNVVPEGVAVGALSLVPSAFGFEPWGLYAGVPIRRIGTRDRESVLAQRDRLIEGLRARAAASGMKPPEVGR